MSAELLRVKEFVQELIDQEKKIGRPKKPEKDNEKLYKEVLKVQRFISRELDAELSDKAAIIYLKWATQKKFSERLKKRKHAKIRQKMEDVHKLTSATVSSLVSKASNGKKALRKKKIT